MPIETVNLFDKKGADDKKFTPTEDELRTIQKKMQDPKFVELFRDYMKSMEDPEARREEEAYLQQVEREAKAGGDFSFDFVFPQPGFVVELLEPSTSYCVTQPSQNVGQKKKKNVSARVYVNMCRSEKIDPFSEETTGDRMKSNWLVPVSVSKPRTEFFLEDTTALGTKREEERQQTDGDDKKEAVVVYDAVFHPTTLQLADHSDRFCCFLVNIAVEHINNGYGDKHGFQFRRLPSRFGSVGTLQNQTITREKGKSPFSAAKDEPVLTRPTKTFGPPASSKAKSDDLSSSTRNKANLDGSATTTTTAAALGTKKTSRTGCDGVAKQENLPRYTIVHRGNIDLTDTWGWKIVDRRVGVPEELVVKMEFTGVQSVADLTVEVEGAYVTIAKSEAHPYYGAVTLPFSVESTPLEAKFYRGKSVLTLVLRVVPPEPTGITAADMRQKLVGDSDEKSGAVEEVKDESERPGDPNKPLSENTGVLGSVDCNAGFFPDFSLEERPRKETELSEERPSVTQLSCLGDQARVQQMMKEVQAARLQREEAAAMAEEKLKRNHKVSEAAAEETTKDDAVAGAAEVSVAVSCEGNENKTPVSETTTTLTAAAADPPVVKECVESVKDEVQLELLRQRQEAWREDVCRRAELRDEAERQAAMEAERETRREAERLRRRAEAAKCQEAMEMKLRERMLELPLRNKHIFSID